MHGFYLIDKPEWITSFWVLRELRKKLGIKKMWHTGTLDPLATGLLLVAVWSYTRLIPYFEKDTKTYTCTIWLDGESDSYDIDTPVRYISEEKKSEITNTLTQESLQKILEENFLWEIQQIPPKYSALKINGKKAVDLVREGKEVIMKKRKASIYDIKILSFSFPDVELEISVSAGTYIRSIAADLWSIVWWGGYIKILRRVKVWKLDVKHAQTLDWFDAAKTVSVSDLFGGDSMIEFDDNMIRRLGDWLTTRGSFDLEINKDYFVKNWDFITNVVRYNWSELIPVKKLAI